MADVLKAALWYAEKGYSIIPVGNKKKPLVKWLEFQERKATEAEIKAWWKRWPNANVAIVTGKISGITVVDLDSDMAIKGIEEYWPENYKTPIATSPRKGQHRYFSYTPELETSVNAEFHTDIRNDRAYIIAAPSNNGGGGYRWVAGFGIHETKIKDTPTNILSYLNSIKGLLLNTISNNIYNKGKSQTVTGKLQDSYKQLISVTNCYKIKNGTRDQALFHIAHCLHKGGMPQPEIEKCLHIIAATGCETPFPSSEIPIKIQSVINRQDRKDFSASSELNELISRSSGIITTRFCYEELQAVTDSNKKNAIRVALKRAEKSGKIKKTGVRAGEYRIISRICERKDWKNAKDEKFEIVLPLGLHECAKVRPGSLLLFASKPNVGKTAMAMDFTKANCSKERINYFSSEIDESEFKERAKSRCALESWNVEFIDGWLSQDIQDIIDPDGINVIDYLEAPDGKFELMTTKLTEIHHNLRTGIAIIFSQIRHGKDLVGGAGMKEKPQILCTMTVTNFPVVEMRIEKCKGMTMGYKNPYNKFAQFKVNIRNGCELIPITPFSFDRWK